MPFPITKLPYLPQVEVLKQLELQELFLLSLCSEKSKKLVQTANLKVEILKFSLNGKGIQVLVESNDDVHCVASMKLVQLASSDETPIKLGGSKVQCRCIEEPPTSQLSHTFQYLQTEEKIVFESIQHHMRTLFRDTPRVQLELSSIAALSKAEVIKDVTDTSFSMETLETSVLENYLSTRQDQQSIQLKASLVGPPLAGNSRLWNVKGLAVHGTFADLVNQILLGPRVVIPGIIRNFGGEHLCFTDVMYNIDSWRQLIRRWRAKEAYHDLRWFSTTSPAALPIIAGTALDEFNLVRWDGIRRPRTVKLDSKIVSFIMKEEIDCSSWMDIQQDGGGKWASIKMTDSTICFVVWD
ncbi:hypothetical protein GCK72_004209 [Caenorhabditis remanei]|uniref:F-box domain-containing protein n=1 Tax=Caenorhabditis remanei TaxID=31234 RepID=A0A6A5HD05_CAERE|nr:hypothetical protein GCK72_004209 [Caenorhabditis remanei]KAF1764262.1 hypothetical protein GCK72_004209 [Caenorhabditis remanei]